MDIEQQMHAEAHARGGGEGLTLAGQLKKMKPWTLVGLGGIVSCLIALWTWHWQIMFSAALLIGMTLGPLCRWWTKHQEACPLDHVLASYTVGLFPLAVVVMTTALIASSLTVMIFSPITMLFWTKSLWRVGMVLESTIRWTSFCFVEEIWLVAAYRIARRRRKHRFVEGSARAQRAFALYATASAVGYATAQCVALACIVAGAMDGHTIFEHGHAPEGTVTASETGGLLLLSLCFAWFLLPLRLLASHLNALDLERAPDASDDGSCALCLPLAATAAPPPGPDGLPLEVEGAPTGLLIKSRLAHMYDVVKWPWGLRAVHTVQFTAFFWLLAEPVTPMNVVTWLVVVFIVWCAIIAAALWRIKFVESGLGANGAAFLTEDTVTLRNLYGFALLEDEEPERLAASMRAPEENSAALI